MTQSSGFVAVTSPIHGFGYPSSRYDWNRPTVLVIDDDEDNLALIKYVLEPFDCLLFCEPGSRAALGLVETIQPNLVLLDIRLPDLTGLELTRLLKSHPATRTIPIIAITALASSQDKAEILQAGCSQYIVKPYLLEDMKTLVGDYIAA
ncbi:MAG: response regulator [Leptolyngbyaceae cyanobacterium SM2_5_2]|nr:response regulator [Leptolyngbyaceae cyanobacterium SM2_5_2]